MRSTIFFILILISMWAIGGNMEEAVSVQKLEGQYSVNYFNHKPEALAYFERKGLQGGGYTWEALVRAAVSEESPSMLEEIEFDSEGDAFNAYTESENVANKIKVIIEKLSSDIAYRKKCIQIAGSEGYLE